MSEEEQPIEPRRRGRPKKVTDVATEADSAEELAKVPEQQYATVENFLIQSDSPKNQVGPDEIREVGDNDELIAITINGRRFTREDVEWFLCDAVLWNTSDVVSVAAEFGLDINDEKYVKARIEVTNDLIDKANYKLEGTETGRMSSTVENLSITINDHPKKESNLPENESVVYLTDSQKERLLSLLSAVDVDLSELTYATAELTPYKPRVKFQPVRPEEPYFLPEYANATDSGADVRTPVPVTVLRGQVITVPLNFRLQLPPGYEIQVRARSGLAKRGLSIVNGVGTADNGYIGEYAVIFTNVLGEAITLNVGDKIAQLVIAPIVQAIYEEDNGEFSATERGNGGFGSTGA